MTSPATKSAATANASAWDLAGLLSPDAVEVFLGTVVLLGLVLVGGAWLSIRRPRRAGRPGRLPPRVFRNWGYLSFKNPRREPDSDPVRVVIYPPGIGSIRTKALHRLSGRPAAGAVPGLAAGALVLLLPDRHLGPPVLSALTLGILVCCACRLVLLRVTGHGVRARCRTMFVADTGPLRSGLLAGNEQAEQDTLIVLAGLKPEHAAGDPWAFHRRIYEEALRDRDVRKPGTAESGP
ncbi:DUF6611 family protein [Paenarthrobacter nicotinovorans]|uniref:DUF6611 family protein n=1 Tax=Paenarthrobacter nicotinovorans TaxID=29320 RepID=UPI00119D2B46|nr:DUF6611 family protein [Paenarthrobacter nicotinovorans]